MIENLNFLQQPLKLLLQTDHFFILHRSGLQYIYFLPCQQTRYTFPDLNPRAFSFFSPTKLQYTLSYLPLLEVINHRIFGNVERRFFIHIGILILQCMKIHTVLSDSLINLLSNPYFRLFFSSVLVFFYIAWCGLVLVAVGVIGD